jgi:hypothetical protein
VTRRFVGSMTMSASFPKAVRAVHGAAESPP